MRKKLSIFLRFITFPCMNLTKYAFYHLCEKIAYFHHVITFSAWTFQNKLFIIIPSFLKLFVTSYYIRQNIAYFSILYLFLAWTFQNRLFIVILCCYNILLIRLIFQEHILLIFLDFITFLIWNFQNRVFVIMFCFLILF